MKTGTMAVSERTHGDVVILSLTGNLLGDPDAESLRQVVYQLLEKDKKKFVLDLHELKYINSMGLGVLIATLTSIRGRGGDLCVARLVDKVEGMLMITKLVRVFRIYDTVEKAIESF